MKSRDQSLNMHRFCIVTGIIAAYSMVILNTVSGGQRDTIRICSYSTDPSSNEPKCYDCDSVVYKNALKACINMTELPQNFSYKAATCIEKNCQIQYPAVLEAENTTVDRDIDFFYKFILDQREVRVFKRPKRSVSDNSVEGSGISNGRHVIKEVSTFGENEESAITFMDPVYFEE